MFNGGFPEQYFSAQEFQLLEFVSAKINNFNEKIPDLCAEQYYCNKKRRGTARDANVMLFVEQEILDLIMVSNENFERKVLDL